MGGAERNARKRRQQQQQQGKNVVAQARGTAGMGGKRVGLIVGVVVVVIAVVVGGVLWTNASKNETQGQTIPVAQPAESQYPEKRDGVVVETGNPDAPATIDVYADFLCPACGSFYERFGEQIQQKVNDGSLLVRTHPVPMLVEASDPPGYSLDAANASLLAADEGEFTAFHDSLFQNQPAEGGRGYGDDQLIRLGRDLGIASDAFVKGVRNGKYDDELTSEFNKTASNPDLMQEGPQGKGFSTPTVTHKGKIVELDDNWLDRITSAGDS
ncbi:MULTISPECIES: DsbA family protein [Prauserella salsuginis group]|uniref:DsbA family protein n=1 Tax=Prauserella salsuginis TaxID=387889 RepID=A0ABW6G7N5_9PSEU|nr:MULTISPECIES: DsbA family protein [Prauserella salsuginis group]MCR3719578.1 Thioredoxin [Prauserella flava]MCR3735408.1 Thioredoxin [Prauserella salsuginis]